jgi:cation transport ATPase
LLEDIAVGRAERDLRSLIDRAPRTAHRRVGSKIEDMPIDQVAIGDAVLVRAGEIVPVDGVDINQARTSVENLGFPRIPIAESAGGYGQR